MFDALAQVMITVLRSLEALTHSYGLAIVLFAVLMKLLLYYPTKQQYQAMADMQRIQPELQKIQEQYKSDPQLSQQKQMEMMRQHNVNPMAGCLPMLIQMPILFAIWRAIMMDQHLFENSYFMWIHPGPLQALFPDYLASSLAGRDLPMILFYGLTMYLSQRLAPTQSSQPDQQKQLAVWMTVLFSWMMWTYNWPCALILYWSVFSLLTIVQQSMILRNPQPVLTA
ncbi:MAG: YidC/Oxa1 family membrane protein insertase [Candidatus Xenobium sp.]|jgi:YidC/Oxa1 family membrane protein insertase|nr:YidC/Oxa1 family membrane protein insertase [Burkholderiales bacterium]